MLLCRTETERDVRNSLYGLETLKKPLNSDDEGMEYNDLYNGEQKVENDYASVREAPYHYIRY